MNPIFQILQMDPGAEKYIGFAKSECRRLMANGTQDFFRTWNLGDATVEAKSYGGSVKLWLKAGLMKLYYDGAVTMPCPGRTLSIVVAKSSAPYIKTNASDSTPWAYEYITSRRDVGDASFAFGGYSSTGSVGAHWYSSSGNAVVSTFGPYPSPPGYAFGTYADGIIDVYPNIAFYDSVGYPGYTGAVNAANLAAAHAATNASGQSNTIILLSDGTQLASFPYTVLDTAGHMANYPLYTTWSGDGWLDLYTDTYIVSNGVVPEGWFPVFSKRETFVVPQDVPPFANSSNHNVYVPGNNGRAVYGVFHLAEYTTPANGVPFFRPDGVTRTIRYNAYAVIVDSNTLAESLGKAVYSLVLADYDNFLVTYAYPDLKRDTDARRVRESARHKTCSDNLKAQLMGWQVDGVPIYQTTQWLDAQKADVTAYMADQSKGLSYTTVTETDTGSYIETATSKVKITGVLSTAGALANEVRYPAKTIHPRSLNTYMPGNFSVQITNSTLSDDSEGSSNQQKTVVVRYTPLKDENNNQPTDITETLTGTKNTVVTQYTANGVAKAGSSTSVTYTKWVDVKVNGDNISVPTLNLAGLFNDVSNAPLLRVMNGATVASPGPYDGSGYAYTPAPPVNSNTVTLGAPDTFKQFRTDYKPKYDKTTTLGAYAVKVLGIFTVTAVDATLSAETIQKTVTWVYQPPSIPVPAINGVEQEPTKPPTTTMQNVGTRRIQVLAYATQTTYTNWMGVPAFNPIGKTDAQKEAAALASFVFRVNGVNFVSTGIYQSGTGPAPTYTPIYTTPPSSYDSTVLDTHPFFATDTKIKTAFLDSKLVDGETITVTPVSTYHSTLGDLGMFPYADDILDKIKLTLKVDMQAKFKYKYIDGSFTFAGSKQKTIPLDDIGVPSSPAPTGVTYTKGVDGKYYISLNHITDKNAVFLSSVNKSAGWPDVMGKPATTAIPATDTTPAIPATTPATYSYLYQQNRLKDPSPSPVLTADEQFLQTISKLSFS